MEKIYLIEVIEPNKKLRKSTLWKQRCNFSIEIIKIYTRDEKRNKKI